MKHTKRIAILAIGTALILGGTIFIGSATSVDPTLALAEEVTRKIFETNENGGGDVIARYLKGLDEEKDYILVQRPTGGYAIFDKESMEPIEYSDSGTSPYSGVGEADSYYVGPTNYFEKKDGKIKDRRTGNSFKEEDKEKVAKELKEQIKAERKARKELQKAEKEKEKEEKKQEKEEEKGKNSITPNDTVSSYSSTSPEDFESIITHSPGPTGDAYNDADSYFIVQQQQITNYKFFVENNRIGWNKKATCATIAAQLLLSYHDFFSDGRIIPSNAELRENYVPGKDLEEFMYYDTYDNLLTEEELKEMRCNIFSDKYPGQNIYNDELRGTTSYDNDDDGVITFYEKLVGYIDDKENGAGPIQTSNGMNNYLSVYAPEAKEDIFIFSVLFEAGSLQIKSEIVNDRPAIAIMNTYNLQENGNYDLDWHSAVAYGYQTIQYQGEEIEGYIMHMGWKDNPTITSNGVEIENSNTSDGNSQSHVWINADWMLGYISFSTTHTHTDEVYNNNNHFLHCTVCDSVRNTNEHIYNARYQILYKSVGSRIEHNEEMHKAFCSCGAESYQPHSLSYTPNKYANNHIKYCHLCKMSLEEGHMEKLDRGYCRYCGEDM